MRGILIIIGGCGCSVGLKWMEAEKKRIQDLLRMEARKKLIQDLQRQQTKWMEAEKKRIQALERLQTLEWLKATRESIQTVTLIFTEAVLQKQDEKNTFSISCNSQAVQKFIAIVQDIAIIQDIAWIKLRQPRASPS